MTNIYEGKKGVVLFLVSLVLCTIIYVHDVKKETIRQMNSANDQIVYANK